MILLAGTMPLENLKLTAGKGKLVDGTFMIGDQHLPLNRGTAAMMAACCAVCKKYDLVEPYCVVSGDIGDGDGSIPIYDYLHENIPQTSPAVIVAHYIMPNLPFHNKVLKAIKALKKAPILIADAGFMYVAKMSGCASDYTIFTPDLGELAFLADEEAPHPFYTRGFIFHMEERAKELIQMAYKGGNAARFLFVKGVRDYVCNDGNILKEINEPSIPELEAIGGTGDTITGMIAAFLCNGLSEKEALISSARVNRVAGKIADPTPATQIGEIISKISPAIDEIDKEKTL